MGSIFVRALILYIIVLIAIRLMGKREIGQLQPFELVVTIMIADLASVPMQDIGIPLLHGVIPILALLVGQLILSMINIKSGIARRIISGKPTVLISNGKIIEKKLKAQKYTMDGLLEQLRVSGYTNIADVEYAILETSGQISIIPKTESMPATKKDMNIKTEKTGYFRPVVIDGSYIEGNIEDLKISKEQVDGILKNNKLSLEDTFLFLKDENGKTYIQKKEND